MKVKELKLKMAKVLKKIYGWGIMISLFVGGLTFLGYLAAFIISGNTGFVICEFLYKKFFPVFIYASNIVVLIGLVAMYLSEEKSLVLKKKGAVEK